MNDLPLVSVVVLTYNKYATLCRCLDNLRQQTWPNLEVIVVDNASSDQTTTALAKDYGDQVRIIRRVENSVTAARNDGFEAARGVFVLSLDNDILLPDPDTITTCVRLMDTFPQAGLLTFRVSSEEQPDEVIPEHWWHPTPWQKGYQRYFVTDFFPEAAAFFRTEALRRTGGYDADYFRGMEQIDVVYKLLGAGYLIVYCPVLVCLETDVRGQLAVVQSPIHYLNLRNKLWTAWKHFPWYRAIPYALGRIAASGVRALRYGWWGYFLQGCREGVFAPAVIRRKRAPLPRLVWQTRRKIKQGWYLPDPLA